MELRATGRAMVADLYVEGTIVPRLPRKAMALMTDYAVIDLERRQKLAGLVLYYGREIPRSSELATLYQEDEDVGEKEAAWLLVQLTQATSTPRPHRARPGERRRGSGRCGRAPARRGWRPGRASR